MAFAAIREFLKLQGIKYQSPAKAGVLAQEMEQYRAMGQAARKEFTDLVSAFQKRYSYLEQERTSQWMNQAQVLRPHFWAYLKGEGTLAEPMYALRLYGDAADFGVSLEVSFIERKKDDQSLPKQLKVLTLPISQPVYYLAQENGESRRIEGTEKNRHSLLQAVADGAVRKVLVKYDIPLLEAGSLEDVLAQFQNAMTALEPYYLATRQG
ncbi:HI_0552 family protein [Streptococcus sp. OMI633]|jgi:hypothetical protein|uniref:HI_0552 family protein n=1 Tax=unclassified Streptococcus TaxID=2608887 RepID=UPI0039C398F0